MIYREQLKIPNIHFINDDFKEHIDEILKIQNVVVVTDPPFNIGYHYKNYKDDLPENEYLQMLNGIISKLPSVIIHYPETLHRLSVVSQITPKRVVSWVYNSNTPRQHRDIAFYNVTPNFKNAWQPYKNPNDKRIKDRLSKGIRGGECMIGGMLIK